MELFISLFVIFCVFIAGYVVGHETGASLVEEDRQKAMKAGVGRWAVSETGKAFFSYSNKTNTEKGTK